MRSARRLALAVLLLHAATASLAAEPLRLVLESAYAPHHVPILMALVQGHFARAGIEPLIEAGLGTNMVAVLVGQRAFDLGHINAPAAAVAISRGAPIRMVAIYQPRTAFGLVGLKGRVQLDRPASVEGKRLGLTPGTADTMALSLFRRANGIGTSAITVIPTDRGAKLADLAAGRLDIVIGDATFLRAGLLAIAQEPEVLELADFGVNLQGFGFVASQALLGENSDLARRALGALRAGFTAAAADPAGACRDTRARFNLADSDEICIQALTIFLASLAPPSAGWGQQSVDAWQRMIEAMRAVGEIQGTRPTSFYYTNAVIP